MKRINEKKRRERLEVIANIAEAIKDGDSFCKVEIGDPKPSERDIKRKIVPFDNLRKKPVNKLKRAIARAIANKATFMLNSETEIIGLENLATVKDGAIITSNHFNPIDCTLIWLLAMCAGRENELSILVQENNIFMKGFFGFLMRNCNTMPVSSNLSYMARNLKPALKKKLEGGELVLIYPEQEMWFNYKKPREFQIGAYHYASEFGVPILPCFAEMIEMDEIDDCGFCKIRYVLHVMPPIYPDETLPFRERREKMYQLDKAAKRECYESVYGITLDDEFIPERDIAGFKK